MKIATALVVAVPGMNPSNYLARRFQSLRRDNVDLGRKVQGKEATEHLKEVGEGSYRVI